MKAFFLALFALSALGMGVAQADSGSKFWDDVLQEKERELVMLQKELGYYSHEVDNRIASFDSVRKIAEERYYQLSFVLLASIQSPYEFRLLSKEIYSLVGKVRKERAASERMLKEIDDALKLLGGMREDMEKLKDKNISAEMRETAMRIIGIITRLEGKIQIERGRLADSLAGLEVYREQWRDSFLKFEEKIPSRLAYYFFNRDACVFWAETWMYCPLVFEEWLDALPFTVGKKVPDSWREWLVVALFLFGGLCLYVFCSWMLAAKFFPLVDLDEDNRRLFRTAAFWGSLALALLAADLVLAFPETVILTRLAVALMAKGAMDFSWGLRRMDIDADSRSPLTALFWLYMAGVGCQILNLNSLLLTFVWPVLVAAACFAIHRDLARRRSRMMRGVMWGALCLTALFGVVSSVGFSMLSIFLSHILFVAFLGMQFGISSSLLLKKMMTKLQDRIGELTKAMVLGIGIPSSWFVIIACMIIWVADQFIELSVLFKLISKRFVLEGVAISIPLLAAVIFLFFAFKTFINVLHTSLDHYLGGHQVDCGPAPSLKRIVTYVVWIGYMVVILLAFDVKLTSLAVIAGGLGVGVGIGLQGLVNNFISGLMILFGRTVRQGDTIQIGSRMAKVVDVNIRSTVIKTKDNAIITVPNANLIANELTNWTMNDPYFRAEIKVGVAYGSDVGKVERLLLEIAANDKRILKTPPPQVLLSDLGGSSMDFTLRVWFDIEHDPYVQSDLRRKIVAAFDENHIVIPFPQMDVRMRQEA